MNSKARNLTVIAGLTMVVLASYVLASHMPVTGHAKYLFIEVKTMENRTTISGEPYPVFIDGPTYDLKGSNLYSTMPPELDSSVRAIYGSHFQLSGDVGSGIASDLYPVRDLPCHLPYARGNISIVDIQGDNITLSCYGNNLALAPGGSWKNETHQVESLHGQGPDRNGDALVDLNVTVAIYNHGRVTLSDQRM